MLVLDRPSGLAAYSGRSLGTRDWQWFHVDAEWVAQELPAGRTIAHGDLVLSPAPQLGLPPRPSQPVGEGTGATFEHAVEVEESARPALLAEMITLFCDA